VPNDAAKAAAAALNGTALASAGDLRFNAAFAYLCAMQIQAYSR
jgi:hypothetical protein